MKPQAESVRKQKWKGTSGIRSTQEVFKSIGQFPIYVATNIHPCWKKNLQQMTLQMHEKLW